MRTCGFDFTVDKSFGYFPFDELNDLNPLLSVLIHTKDDKQTTYRFTYTIEDNKNMFRETFVLGLLVALLNIKHDDCNMG